MAAIGQDHARNIVRDQAQLFLDTRVAELTGYRQDRGGDFLGGCGADLLGGRQDIAIPAELAVEPTGLRCDRVPIRLVHPSKRLRSPRLRAFADALEPALAASGFRGE